mgnify:CR=1 FL=1
MLVRLAIPPPHARFNVKIVQRTFLNWLNRIREVGCAWVRILSVRARICGWGVRV